MYKLFLFVCFCFTVLPVLAQKDIIETDRPDQTESPSIVPKNWVQLEMGFLQQTEKYSKTYKDRFFQHPTLLSKYGLSKCFEFRLITEFTTEKTESSNFTDVTSGINNIQFGGKVNFFDEKKLRPKTSLIAHYNFGFTRKYGIDTADGFNFRFTMQNTISPVVSLGYNIGMQWEKFYSAPAYIYTFAPGFNISEKWYAYIEAFGFIRKNRPPENSVDAGIAYNVNNNFKLDISAGLGLSEDAPDRYFAIGASYRFKTGKN